MARHFRRIPTGMIPMKDDTFNLKCSITNNVFKQAEPKISVQCSLSDGIGNRIGDLGVSYKSGDGNNLDIKVSKDLVMNLLSDSINLDNVLGKLFS